MGLDNPLHIAFLLIVVLMVFGAKAPARDRQIARPPAMRGFKDAAQHRRRRGRSAGGIPSLVAGPPADEQPDRERAAA